MSNQLKAFVGHSFTDDDKPVVREFLDYFNQIKDMNIGFSWEHAEKAEPRELADKVLRLMEDKNLFIGICTNKEVAIDSGKLTNCKLNRKMFKAERAAVTSKTSDWITQEIGLAVGREMDLILLLENGVREPGGLQGNREYIPFDRDSPSKSFGKILEMITDLRPKAKAVPIEQAEIRAAPVKQDEAQDHQTGDQFRPKDDWDINKYRVALFRAIMTDNDEEEKVINEAFFASKVSQDNDFRETWEAMGEYFRILDDKGGKLANLETLAKKYPENVDIQRFLALAYGKYDEHNRAAIQFENAAQKAGNKLDEMKLYGQAALSYTQSSQKYESDITIEKMKEIIPAVENGEVELIKVLCKISEITDDQDLFFGLSEKLLQISPDDIDSRFQLAYKYSTSNKDELALFHYLKIPEGLRGLGSWNNLGVGFDKFDLTNKAVKAYRQAEKLEETLAMSNLANKFIKAGFLEEAEDICNRALTHKNYNKNILDSISRIKAIPDEEEKQEKTITAGAKTLSEFYRDYGHASLKSSIVNHVGQWKGPLCDFNLSIKDNQLIATGKYMQLGVSAFGLAFAGGMLPGLGTPKKEIWYEVMYEGKIFGQTAKCIFTKKEAGEAMPTRGLLGGQMGTQVLMIISDSLREIKVYEKSSGDAPIFYNLNRIDYDESNRNAPIMKKLP